MTGLQKHIGAPALLSYYVSSVVGVGILIIPGVAAQIAGPASLVAWILLALISAPVAISFAAMAMAVPDSGGVPAFVAQRYSPSVGNALSLLLTLTMVIGNPVMGLASAYYLRELIPFNQMWLPWVAYAFMVLSVGFNLLGVQFGSRIQTIALCILIGGLVVIVGAAVPKVQTAYMHPFMPGGWGSIGAAMVVCFFSFLGWENVSSIAEEVKAPERTFGRVIPWAVLVVGGLYLAISWIFLSVVPPQTRSESPTILGPILHVLYGPRVALAGNAVALLLLVTSTNAWVLGASRQVFSLARSEILPQRYARLNDKGSPTGALLILVLGYAFILALTAFLGLSEKSLIRLANADFMIIYAVAFAVGAKTFKASSTRACAILALIATLCFTPFFKWILLISACLFLGSLAWLSRRDPKNGEDVARSDSLSISPTTPDR